MRVTDISTDMDGIMQQNREREAQVAKLGNIFSAAQLMATEFPQYVVIDADGWIALDASGTMYDFDGAEIRTPLHLLTWIRHLSGKRWFTHHHAGQLIDVVCEAKGWQLPND